MDSEELIQLALNVREKTNIRININDKHYHLQLPLYLDRICSLIKQQIITILDNNILYSKGV